MNYPVALRVVSPAQTVKARPDPPFTAVDKGEKMKIWHLITKEIWHSKLSFAASLISIVMAIGVLVGAFTLLKAHDKRTERVLQNKEDVLKQRMAELQEDMRKATLELGFNLLILPEDLNLSNYFADSYAKQFMPEDYVHKLAESEIITVRHLLPILEQKAEWPEKNRTVIVAGTKGEVPKLHKPHKDPFAEQTESRQGVNPVDKGTMILGYELARQLDLKKGDTVTFQGKEFTVDKCHAERGNKDDITIWMNLDEVQSMLGKEGKINAIMALQCLCPGSTIAQAKSDIKGILPDTQVKAKQSEAIARIQARQSAADKAKKALNNAEESRAALRNERESLASILVPIVMGASVVWIGLMGMANVRDRRGEIALLRAVGLRARHILTLFMSKAVILGILGGVLGFVAGFYAGGHLEMQLEEVAKQAVQVETLFDWKVLVLAIALAPCLSAAATWIPAMIAAQQDPADVLREE